MPGKEEGIYNDIWLKYVARQMLWKSMTTTLGGAVSTEIGRALCGIIANQPNIVRNQFGVVMDDLDS